MIIRPATFMDFRSLVDIGHKFFEFNLYRQWTQIDRESLTKTFQFLIDQHLLLIAEIDGKVIGAAAAFIAPLYWNHSYTQGVEAFWWIDPEHRRNGAGRELRLALQEAGKAKGVEFWNMLAMKDSMYDIVSKDYLRDGFIPVETTFLKVL